MAACGDPVAEILHALTHPLDTPVPPQIMRPGEKVIIPVDDHTRVTPVAQILPLLLEQLRTGGVRDEDVTVLISHGTHRLSTVDKVRGKVGEDVHGRFHIVQHQCTDEGSQVYLELTSRGTPV